MQVCYARMPGHLNLQTYSLFLLILLENSSVWELSLEQDGHKQGHTRKTAG